MGRILVIEDEPGPRLLLQSRLQDLGHDVVTAPTGAMGLMEANAARFDLFLVDVVLGPGIDGYEVARRLRSSSEARTVPIVLMSGHDTSSGSLHRGYEAGCEAFLLKEDLTLLEDVVRAMLRIKSLQDDLAAQNYVLEEHNRRLQEEQARGADLEVALRETGMRSLVFRELAAGHPDGVLLVNAAGIVQCADRGAREMLGKDVEDESLGRLVPGCGLEAFVRDALTEARHGFRFDIPARAGRTPRSLTASVIPVIAKPGAANPGVRVVLLLDAGKRRVAAEMLRLQETGLRRRDHGALVEAAREAFCAATVLGTSDAAEHLRAVVARDGALDVPVLILGEVGTGKDFVARSIHFGGTRPGPFVQLDCGALSESNADVEVFGQVKGAYDDAYADRPGLLQQARMGTLYLAEVGELPRRLQEKMLEALRSGSVRRIGADRDEPLDVRVIASTSTFTDSGEPDERIVPELLEWLCQAEVRIPPLRERPEDILVFADELVRRFARRPGTEIDSLVRFVLESHDWPNNVAELRAFVHHACELDTDGLITEQDLTGPVRDLFRTLSSSDRIPRPALEPERTDGENGAGEQIAPAMIEAGSTPISFEYYEKLVLMRALERTRGDKLEAAKLLGVGKSTLYRKLKRHRL